VVPRPPPVGMEVDRLRLRDASTSSLAIRAELTMYCREVVIRAEVNAAFGTVLIPPVKSMNGMRFPVEGILMDALYGRDCPATHLQTH
jgi:hypothetical protein